jgi:hypothetical protein
LDATTTAGVAGGKRCTRGAPRPEAAYDDQELFNEAVVAGYTSAVQAAGEPAM